MDRSPVIGLITQIQEEHNETDPFAVVTNQQYLRALVQAGAEPRRIPLLHHDEDRLRNHYDRIDGLMLTGGADVDPSLYGEERHPQCHPSDLARDHTEIKLFRWAWEDRKPIFGICRGMQLVNVAAGGTLYQDLRTQCPQAIKHDYFSNIGGYPRDLLSHEVRIDPSFQLGQVMGMEQVQVNSLHHQGVKQLAPGFVATAFGTDGIIEGMETTDDRFVLAVQWHPEELIDLLEVNRRLFAAFIDAARRQRD